MTEQENAAAAIPVEVRELAERVPMWANAPAPLIVPLKGTISLNNSLYRVTTGGVDYILRYAADAGRYLGIRREEELAAAQAAAEANLAPAIFYAEPGGHTVMPFLVARHWEPADFQEPVNIARIADALRRLHAIQGVNAPCSVYQRIERLLESAGELNLATPPDLERHREKLHRLEAERAANPRPSFGLNHNDLWANNFLDDGEKIYLLDWEFAGNGDGLFDLTTISFQAPYSDAQLRAFLNAYGKTADDAPQALADTRFIVSFFEAGWALVLHNLRGSAGFDYQKHAHLMFERLSEES